MSQDGESWIWQMMLQDIENKSKPEKTQGLMQGGRKFGCEDCEYRAKTGEHLKIHTQAVHEGLRFPCNLCSFKATGIANLSKHKDYRHEGVIFSCKICGHKSGSSAALHYHRKTAHSGRFYKCNHCEHASFSAKELRKHVKGVHLETPNSQKCNQCEYTCSKRSDLRKHMNSHGGIWMRSVWFHFLYSRQSEQVNSQTQKISIPQNFLVDMKVPNVSKTKMLRIFCQITVAYFIHT